MNKKMFRFPDVEPISDSIMEGSGLQNSMLFEFAVVLAEQVLSGASSFDRETCLSIAIERQRHHFDARIPDALSEAENSIADWAAGNLVKMVRAIMSQHSEAEIVVRPTIPGMGWISSGVADFSLGPFLIEVKHTDRNFIAGDFRQILIYWILKYAASLEGGEDVWPFCLLLNPRRNAAITINFDYLLRSASPGLNRVEIIELMRSVVSHDFDNIQ